MSELIQKRDNHTAIRWKLLAGVSALALTAYISSANLVSAEDSDHPQIWIELGGQLSRLQDSQELFAPPFVALTPSNFSPPQAAENPPGYGLDESAALTFQPKGSDWIFSAAIHYSRASTNQHVRHQSYPLPFSAYEINRHGHRFYVTVQPSAARFTDVVAKQGENHAILDFQVGKDVGLGLFGTGGSSSINVGVRIAQFQSKSRVALGEDPDWRFDAHVYDYYGFIIQAAHQPYHSYAGTFRADRSFHGIGPSLAWKSSLPFVGNSQDGALMLDWGVNGSLLFGRQKTRTQHETTALYHPPGTGPFPGLAGHPTLLYHHAPPPQTRSRTLMVPNVGGFAGLSFRYSAAKVSFGYRADMFFGAIDGGIDARKSENRGFFGPFASVSIGVGG